MAQRWYVVHVHSGFEKKVAQNLREQTKIQEMDDYHSGGGFIHLFFRLGNNRIFSFHCPLGDGMFEAVEISYHTYKSIDEYIDTEPEVKPSFGYEYENPNYEQRRFCMWCGKNGDGRDHCDDHS